MKRSITVSLITHMGLILLLIGSNRTGSKGMSKDIGNHLGDDNTIEIVEKPKEKDAPESYSPGPGDKKLNTPHSADKCSTFFGGIGITTTSAKDEYNRVGVVTEIYEGYPAALGGVMLYDVILNRNGIIGEIGTPVTLLIRRNGNALSLTLIRDKICTQERVK